MSWRALIVAYFALSSAAFSQPVPLAQEELLHSARVWEARDRGDLARLALEKLVAARPDSPWALVELGELLLRMADFQAAQTVQQQLANRFPGSPEARTFATELRFATRDRLQIASVQRLIQVNRGNEAHNELAKLFPGGAPDGTLGLEYFRLLARTPGGWERSFVGLRRLAARHAGDPRYQFALARHLLERETTALEGVRLLTQLAQREDVRSREIDDPLRSTLIELDYRRAPSDVLRSYASRHRDDPQIAELLSQRLQLEGEQELLVQSASGALDPDQQRRNLLQMQQALLAMQPKSIGAQRAIALIRRLRVTDENVATRFDEPTEVALSWALRSRQSGFSDSERAAIEKDIAVAFAQHNPEAAIELAKRLDAQSLTSDADQLLADAARLDARSTWLFETRVRRLLSQSHVDEAVQLLETRPIDAHWSAAARDELLASALDQRAQRALTAGDTARARADLERAIQLEPAYPWTRFRLAGLWSSEGNREGAVALMRDGARQGSTNPEMRYAQALLLSSIGDATGALAALDGIPVAARTESMQALGKRLRIDDARAIARRLAVSGKATEAGAVLLTVDSLAHNDLEATAQLAAAWIDIGDATHGLALFDTFLHGRRADDTDVLLAWADTLNRADDARVAAALEQLNARTSLTPEERQQVATIAHGQELRTIRALQREGKYALAVSRLDALLARTSDDRSLRSLRAELDMSAGNPAAARDRYAALVAERPDDLEMRLAYARALTDAGDVALARLQVHSVAEQAAVNDVDLRLSLARRQLDVGDAAGASRTLDSLLAANPTHSDALLLAGRAQLAQRDFVRAQELFAQAERSSDMSVESDARLARETIETRLQGWMEAGTEWRHKPGDSGISQFDSLSVPTLWRRAHDYEHRLTLRTDAVSIDAGRLDADFDTAALLGTIQAAGPDAQRRYGNDREDGLSVGLRYDTDTLSADIGTTPLGFLLTNIVGGIEWAPEWGPLDLAFGIERRAITSSVLSYAGMRDPISGREWGGVVESGPYAEAGFYRENYSIAGAIRHSRLTGENVADNTFAGARVGADWKFWSRDDVRAFAGITVNLWSYERNLQNYTFGHGGYYSPETYMSIALPLELQGTWRDWSYRLRASLSFSSSDIERAPFYPNDPALQTAAAASPLPEGFDAPYYDDEGGSGTSVSAYASIEKRISRTLVVGAKLDIDRADYYEPTTLMLYVRHVFGTASTPVAIPPRPPRAYNE